MAISFAGLSGGGGKVQKTEFIKSTQNWTAPDDVTDIELILVAGGGGGGNISTPNNTGYIGAAGGAGQLIHKDLEVTPGQSYLVTIGAGGSRGGQYGTKGGNSSFGNLITAFGGTPYDQRDTTTGIGPTGTYGGPSNSVGSAGGGGGNSSSGDQGGNANSRFDVPTQEGFGFAGGGSNGVGVPTGGRGFKTLGGGGTSSKQQRSGLDEMAEPIQGIDGGGGGGRFTHPNGGSNLRVHASSGEINTGGGAGGGGTYGRNNIGNSNNRGALSGSGGSGICIIKYWTEA